ncbi:hypothetical protein AAGG74_16775 [Bacillus mexicanus]|uniref:hypothetical protein n=1 Tax=Bacillus mexicanus TaxID=2834415 RepID=UPI003D1C6A64
MSIKFKEKLFNALEKTAANKNYDFVIHSDSESKGKVFIMDGFVTLLSFTYAFSHRSFTLTFYEKGQEPVMGKPLLSLSVEEVIFTDNNKITELLNNVQKYLDQSSHSLKTA